MSHVCRSRFNSNFHVIFFFTYFFTDFLHILFNSLLFEEAPNPNIVDLFHSICKKA